MADAEPATDAFGGLDIDRVIKRALTPPAEINAPKIQSDLTKIGRQESAETGQATERQAEGIDRDRDAIHRFAQGIEPVPDQQWDANKERQKYTTDPMQEFGSFGFLLTTLASAFTRQPMINSLTAAGAFMDAANKKNDKDYDRAYEAFKENSSLALKRHEMQREAYDDAIKLLNTDVAAGKAELEAIAAKYGDKRRLALVEGGHFKELAELNNADREAATQMLKLMPQIEELRLRHKELSLDPDYQSGDPTRMAQAEVRLNRRNNLTPEQQIWDKYQKENPEGDAKKDLDFYKELRAFGSKTTLDAARRDEIYRKNIQDWKEKNPGKEVPIDVMNRANFSAIGKTGAAFSEESLDTMTDLYLGGNRTVLTNVGRGAQGPENLDRFWTKLSTKMIERGDTADDVNHAQQDFVAQTAGLRLLWQRDQTLNLATNEAEALVPRVKAISDRIDRTKFPSMNALIMSAEKGVGGEDVIRMGVAVNSLIPVYARSLKPVGQVTVDDLRRSEHILDQYWSKGQINAALDQMMLELGSARTALDKTMMESGSKQSRKLFKKDSPETTIRYDAEGNRITQ